jgi:hypothetical protein
MQEKNQLNPIFHKLSLFLIFLTIIINSQSYRIFSMQREKLKILYISIANRMRSATAEKIFQPDQRFEVDSCASV